ncbi:MAG: aldo/keto reductase, partial [Oscillospiraceae bacterium]|nr:aldo/keto reductase [Oscillospiraceae bacterium]
MHRPQEELPLAQEELPLAQEELPLTQVEQMVDYAMAHGVNYYDTAWGYHGGNSELSLGKALAKHPRDKFYLADKFPGYDLSNMPKVEEIFEKQLQKCGVEYFDFYLFHNVCEMNIDAYLDDETYGIFSYLMEQKKNGRIRHLGFSCHGAMPVLKRFLEAYGAHMEFCQLQLNYVDWTFQGCKEKVELLKEYNIPVWVMEPLRGGRLCALPQAAQAALAALRPHETPTAWAFRFIQSIPQVTVTLSGMSNFQQMKENIDTFGTEVAQQISMATFLYDVVFLLLMYVILCFITGGFKKRDAATFKK